MELLERESFLDTLAEYAREARQGDGRLILISGESGIGKTALLEAFQQQLKGVRWLWGACDGLLTPRPLGPLFDIGSQLDGELATLCRQDAPRDQLFAAFLAEVGSPATFTVAVIEDVHWADEATIDLLNFLGRRLSRRNSLVLVSYRDSEGGADHPLRIVLGDLATQRATRRMRLPRLSERAVRQLAERRDVDAAELYRITGGNPFYVSEMLDAGWPSVPSTVSDAVGARLARCTQGARELVQTAAVIGARVSPSLLAAVHPGASSPADEVLATGMLIPDGADLRFRHELVRMAVDGGIAPHRRTGLHVRLLAALEELGDADAALLAHHAEGAGNAEAVLRHAPAAAQRSSELGAHREAAAQYARALRFSGESDPQVRAALNEGIANEFALLDHWEEAEPALRTAIELRRALGDGLRVGEDLSLLSTTLWRLCRGKESDEAIHESVRVLQGLPPGRGLAWAYAMLGATYIIDRRLDKAIEAVGKARQIGDRYGDPELESYGLNAIGLGMVAADQDGMATLEHALRVALDADLQESAGRAYSSMQEACARLPRFADSERYFNEGVDYCDEHELRVFRVCVMGWRSQVLMLLGRWDEAAWLAAQTLNTARISPVNRLNPLRVVGTIRGRRGDATAWELLDEALVLAEGTAEPQWIVPVRTARAELRWLAGRADEAAEEASLALAIAPGHVDQWTRGSAASWLARSGSLAETPAGIPGPCALELAGDWAAAAAAWQELGRPYARPLPGSARQTRPGCGMRCGYSTTLAPSRPRPRSGAGCGRWASARSRAGRARPPARRPRG